MSDEVLRVEGLQKTFRIGFFRKRVEAVRDVSFSIMRGEIFGLLGPNGAGKTTTIKMVLRLIFPDAGTIRIFGVETRDRRAMERVGYMPENPYVYQYLRPLEFLDLAGRLAGMAAADRRSAAAHMLERVGLSHAVDRPIGKFSKGMMQRIGLAQALLHDPELLILDEPMSGLDPLGRKEVRDLLLEQRERGKTLLFTSHILTDVESLCDRVVILNQGKVTKSANLHALLEEGTQGHEVELEGLDGEKVKQLEALQSVGLRSCVQSGRRVTVRVEHAEALSQVLSLALKEGWAVRRVTPQGESLENLFVEMGQPKDVASPSKSKEVQ